MIKTIFKKITENKDLTFDETYNLIIELGKDRLDVTVGSSLDIFGGSGMKYTDAVAFNQQQDVC